MSEAINQSKNQPNSAVKNTISEIKDTLLELYALWSIISNSKNRKSPEQYFSKEDLESFNEEIIISASFLDVLLKKILCELDDADPSSSNSLKFSEEITSDWMYRMLLQWFVCDHKEEQRTVDNFEKFIKTIDLKTLNAVQKKTANRSNVNIKLTEPERFILEILLIDTLETAKFRTKSWPYISKKYKKLIKYFHKIKKQSEIENKKREFWNKMMMYSLWSILSHQSHQT